MGALIQRQFTRAAAAKCGWASPVNGLTAPLLAGVQATHKPAVFTRHGGGDAVGADCYRYMKMRAARGRGKLRAVGLFDLDEDPHENHNVAEQPHYAHVRGRSKKMLAGVWEK